MTLPGSVRRLHPNPPQISPAVSLTTTEADAVFSVGGV